MPIWGEKKNISVLPLMVQKSSELAGMVLKPEPIRTLKSGIKYTY